MRGDPPFLAWFSWHDRESTPHARGSTRSFFVRSLNQESTPHARGSTLIPSKGTYYIGVYPACAGIHPLLQSPPLKAHRLPRMRGDPPFICRGCLAHSMSTPHARGSTRLG